MKINIFDGTISFEHGEIGRKLRRPQFLETSIGRSSTERLVNERWRHYEIDPEKGIAGTVLFEGDAIDRIFLSMTFSNDRAREWSAELELERKAKHDQWLREELGEPPYRYDWGRVASEFDPKGLASEIIVVYEK